MFRKLARYQIVVDVVFAATFTLLFLSTGTEIDGVPATVVLIGYGLALALRRGSPALALALSWIVAIGQMAAGLGTQPGNLAILFVLFSTAAYGTVGLRRLGLASVAVGGIAAALYLTFVGGDSYVYAPSTEGRTAGEISRQLAVIVVPSWGVLGLSWALGRISLANRMSVEEKHQRALAEMEQAQVVQDIAVEHERNRIARDMHDIVAHSLAVVIAQADGARYARAIDPDSVDRALTTIASTARDALRDVRGVLAQLRHSADDVPAVDSQNLDGLAERMRGAGLKIDFITSGDPADLGASGQLTLYRIAQEALTNALRHGDSRTPVSVVLAHVDENFVLTVRNRVASDAVAKAPGGHGLIGMRERAALSDGSLTADLDQGEWTLVARLPVVGGSDSPR